MQHSRPKRIKRFIIQIIILAILAGCTVAGAYTWFKHRAVQIVQQMELPESEMNGVKHAFAAGQTMQWFAVVLPNDWAGTLVTKLGHMNEYIEYMYRAPARRDSSEEMLKDLHNNNVGIAVAEWLREQGDTHSESIATAIGELAQKNIVNTALHSKSDEVEQTIAHVTQAIETAEAQQEATRAAVREELDSDH